MTNTSVIDKPVTQVIDNTITPKVGRYITVTHVTELYCPACYTGLTCHEEADVESFVATHFNCVPEGYG